MGTIREPEVKEEDKKPKTVKKKRPVLDEDGQPKQGEDGEAIVEEYEEVVAEDDEPEPEPTSFELCSPQLLHLDLDGKPLWFNGWLLDNKFADKKQKKFGKFDHYLIEPHDIREPGAWQLEESNMCCLTTDIHLKRDFTSEDKAILEMMINQAREVGVTG